VNLPVCSFELAKRVEQYCISNQLILPDSKILIGCSGGGDSVALTVLLHLLRDPLEIVNLHLAFLNHCIRPANLVEEEKTLVESLAKRYNIPLTIGKADVPELAKEKKLSLESAARQARLSFLKELAQQYKCKSIALGHNADDRSETILFNIIRGSGSKGIIALQPKRGMIIRPLLNERRSALRAFLQELNITWCEDQTNLDLAFSRNLLRIEIMPLLEEINPQAVSHLNNLAELLTSQNLVFEELINTLITDRISSAKDSLKLNKSDNADLIQWLVYLFLKANKVPSVTNRKVNEIKTLWLSHHYGAKIPFAKSTTVEVLRDGIKLNFYQERAPEC